MARMIPEFIASPESPSVVTEGLVLLPQDTLGAVLRCPNILRHPIRATSWAIRMLFGLFSLTLLLAVIAAIPLVNILSLLCVSAVGDCSSVWGDRGRIGRVVVAGLDPDFGPGRLPSGCRDE